jgi:citrate synthase
MSTVAYRPGLEGVVVAQTGISHVDGQNGRLIYRGGRLIEEVADRSFEDVAHLLWKGELPDAAARNELCAQLAAHRALNSQSRAALAGLGRDVDPMDALRTLVSAQGATAGLRKPSLEQAIEVAAAFPTIIASFYRHQQGLEPIEPREDLGHAANFLYMMAGREADAAKIRYLDAYLVLLADHGLNASTFAVQVVASTRSDLTSAVVAGIAALKGPAHGGAATAAMDMLLQVGGPENAERFVLDTLNRHERLSGFGHRVYRTYDPRARILRQMAHEANPSFYAVASKVEEVALRELLARHPERPNQTNVDYYSAGVLEAAGIPKEHFTCVFAASRVVGWTAHVLEYMSTDGRLIRPASDYVGPEPQEPRAASA